MNGETCIELSSNSSQESLAEGKESVAHQTDWKEKTKENEIEISESKAKIEEDDCIVAIEGATAAATSDATPMTKTESLTRDVRRLKSATLDRMGKMLKIHSKSSSEKPDIAPASSQDATRKQKFNSLTRMLRFTDKEDKSKSPEQCRGRSLTRILRKKMTTEGDNPPDKPDEHIRGIFSRILGQIRGRNTSKANSATENSQKDKEKTSTLSKLPSNSGLSDLNLESSCPIMNAHH